MKAALHQHLGRALRELGGTSAPPDVSLHEARKQLKRARASLRLLRDSIGETFYQRANQKLRDAANSLSRVRDSKVLLDAAAKLRAETKEAAHRAELASLEKDLRIGRRRMRQQLLKRPTKLRNVRRTLRSVLSSSRPWPAPTDELLRCAVERIYRKGRKSFDRVKANGCDETLHESRKQTKYLGNVLELLAPTAGGQVAKYAKCAGAIADALGDDHDLAMLRERLARRPRSGSARQALIAQIEDRRQKLQRKAAKDGRHLYRRKPKTFVNVLDLHARAR